MAHHELMTGFGPASTVSRDAQVPGAVTAAAVVTITAAGIIAAFVIVLAAGFAYLGSIIVPYSEHGTGPLIAGFVGVVLTLLALCGLAVGASVALLRRRRWGWRTLSVLAPLTAALGVAMIYYGVTLLAVAAAVAVMVLLWRPSTRAWFASADQAPVARATAD